MSSRVSSAEGDLARSTWSGIVASSRILFALKEVIDPNKRDRERFIFEGEILKRLDHLALPRVYRAFEHDKLRRVYLLMDYVKGRNLETLRKEHQNSLCAGAGPDRLRLCMLSIYLQGKTARLAH